MSRPSGPDQGVVNIASGTAGLLVVTLIGVATHGPPRHRDGADTGGRRHRGPARPGRAPATGRDARMGT
jgi:hypothetical protein